MKIQEKFISYLKKTINGKLQKANISTSKTSKTSIFTYQSLKEIKLLTYDAISETGNVCLMDKNYSDDKKYTQKDIDLCNDAFMQIVDLFIDKLKNKKALNNFADTKKKTELTYKIYLLNSSLQSLLFIAKNYKNIENWEDLERSLLNSVKKLSTYVVFKPLNDFDDNIKIIEKLIKSNDNTYKRLFPDDEPQSVKYSLDDQVTDITMLLELKFELDLETMTLEKWCSWLNRAESKIQMLRKEENGRGKK